jgi:hypothetical protein
MGIFRRNGDDDEPLDPEARSPQLGLKYKDLAVLGSLMDAGADLSRPRHVVFYSYGSSSASADAMANEARAKGFDAEVRDPLPQERAAWACICQAVTVLTPEFVRVACDFFEDLARRYHAEYDGWEAAL